MRPDLDIQPIRGNVDTRLRKQKNGDFQAILLAAAGLRRLGLEQEIAEIFSAEQVCPAPGQGALAVQTRVQDQAFEICRVLNHAPTEQAVLCERTVLASLGGGCQLPVGVFAQPGLRALAVVVAPDGSRFLRESALHPDALELGHMLANRLLERGALDLLSAVAHAP
jgi:hydroxymethylbilane synthase